MTRREVKEFLYSGIQTIGLGYGTGRISEFNSDRSQTYPKTWIEPVNVSTTLTQQGLNYDGWSVVLHIGKKDAQDSLPEQYEELVDDCDEYAQQLINAYNQIVSGYKTVTIESVTRVPFVKKNADVLTGVILSFTLNAPDTTNLC